MKLPENEKLMPMNDGMKSLKKSLFYLFFLLSACFFYSCSGDDDEDTGPSVDPSVPYSVTINSQNKNLPSGGGVITSEYSDSPTGSDIGKTLDGSAETKFVTSHSKFYILWAGNNAAAVNYYSLTSAKDSPTKDPKSWSLSGSNDKNKWVALDKQTDQSFSQRQEKKEYRITNETAYKYYRLDIEKNNGDAATQIAEWTMQVLAKEKDPLVPHSVEVASYNVNMPSAGVITSQYSDFASGSDISKIVDNNSKTKFMTNHSSFYILWKGKENATVNYYSLTSAYDYPQRDPKSWKLSGSNDSLKWTVIDTQTDQKFSNRESIIRYSLDNKTTYKYYRLDVEKNNGDASTQIAELTLEEVPFDFEDLMSKAGGSSFSSLTPMGSHYANRHITTDEDRAWFNDASNEPPAPEHVSHLKLVEFPVNLFPFGKPVPADVNQHAIGDCGGLAAMASMAYLYPDFVKKLIKDNGDKTYTVSMFDPQGKPLKVTVSSKFLSDNGSNIDAVSGKNNTATWSTILEKALMKWNCIYKANTDIGGIGSEHIPPLFTGEGNSFSFAPEVLSAKELARVVRAALVQGKFVIGGFNRGDLPIDGSKTVTAHAYTMTHSTDRSALFSMRNPWGGNPDVSGSLDGVLNVPNNTTIPKIIDLRIVDPGIAGDTGTFDPYIPPTLKSSEAQMRVADYLLRPSLKR